MSRGKAGRSCMAVSWRRSLTCSPHAPLVPLQLLRSHKGIAAQMEALRESIDRDFKQNLGVIRARGCVRIGLWFTV